MHRSGNVPLRHSARQVVPPLINYCSVAGNDVFIALHAADDAPFATDGVFDCPVRDGGQLVTDQTGQGSDGF
ncbi:hypothetical protein D3C76_1387470 [compost metagenome]